MSEIQNNISAYEDEIDLRELFMALWKNKYIILAMGLILAILSGMFSMFVLSPVFETQLDIIINMPEKYNTRYGDYTLPINSNDQYINLFTSNLILADTIKDMGYNPQVSSLESLRKRISIKNDGSTSATGQNTFRVTVSADNPEESLKLAQTLFDNYIDFVDVMTKERAVNHYYNHYSVSLLSLQQSMASNQELLEKNEILLAETSQTINQKALLEETQGALVDSIDFVVLDNIINENYFALEKDVITYKQTIYSLENSIRVYNEYLSELEVERQNIENYYKNNERDSSAIELIGVVKTNIYLPSPPVAPNRKTSPSNAKNAAIGMVIGLMLGLAVVYVREFWLKKES